MGVRLGDHRVLRCGRELSSLLPSGWVLQTDGHGAHFLLFAKDSQKSSFIDSQLEPDAGPSRVHALALPPNERLCQPFQRLGQAGVHLHRRMAITARGAPVDDDDGMGILAGATDETQAGLHSQ